MTNDEIYDFIGELAIALYSKKIQISLGSLRIIMLDKGKDYVNNRGMASAVSAAYRRWKEKDPIIYYAIAYTYTDREGNLAWDDPRKTSEKAAEATAADNEEVPDAASKEVPKSVKKTSSKKKTAEPAPEAVTEQDLFSEPVEPEPADSPVEQAEPVNPPVEPAEPAEEEKTEEPAEEISTASQEAAKPVKKQTKKPAAKKSSSGKKAKAES